MSLKADTKRTFRSHPHIRHDLFSLHLLRPEKETSRQLRRLFSFVNTTTQ